MRQGEAVVRGNKEGTKRGNNGISGDVARVEVNKCRAQ
jgi:hypothetical protein